MTERRSRSAATTSTLASNKSKTVNRPQVPKDIPTPLERILAVGDSVYVVSTIKPKQYVGRRGKITSVNDGEYCVGDAWFRASELVMS